MKVVRCYFLYVVDRLFDVCGTSGTRDGKHENNLKIKTNSYENYNEEWKVAVSSSEKYDVKGTVYERCYTLRILS